VAHNQQISWLGTHLKELASAVEEKGARGGKQDIAPMGGENIGLALAARWRNDDLDLGHFMPTPGIGLAACTGAISMSSSLRPVAASLAQPMAPSDLFEMSSCFCGTYLSPLHPLHGPQG
jgi:hypothetical protein